MGVHMSYPTTDAPDLSHLTPPRMEDYPNVADYENARREHCVRMIAELSELMPEHAVAPEDIPNNIDDAELLEDELAYNGHKLGWHEFRHVRVKVARADHFEFPI